LLISTSLCAVGLLNSKEETSLVLKESIDVGLEKLDVWSSKWDVFEGVY